MNPKFRLNLPYCCSMQKDTIKKLLGVVKEVEDFKTDDNKLSDVLAKEYPLLTNISWSSKINNEVAIYINAK
mgnify:CR=1 FL=1